MEPLTDVRDISRIAYGFIGSKALFAALELDLFSRLLEPKSIQALAQESGIPAHRVKTLLATLTALGLMDADQRTRASNGRVPLELVRHHAALSPTWPRLWAGPVQPAVLGGRRATSTPRP